MRDIANSPARSAMPRPSAPVVRPFVLLAGSVLERVTALFQSALANWCEQWGVAAGSVGLHCVRAFDESGQAASVWRTRCSDGEAAVWQTWSPGWHGALAQALFAPDSAASAAHPAASLAPAAAQAACEQLRERLTGLILPERGRPDSLAPPAQLWKRGAGSIIVRASAGTHTLNLLLDSASVASLLTRNGIAASAAAPAALAKRVDYLHVLRALPLRLTVQAGSVQLGLGSLASVGVGDVIRLDAAIDAPVAVLGSDGQALLHAYLGQSDGQVALELSGRAAPHST